MEVDYRQATPRERQFGYYGAPSRSSSSRRGDDDDDEPIELPIGQLHLAAAQRQLPLVLDAAGDDGRDPMDVVRAWSALLTACQDQAPELLQYWHTGLSPLLRLAAVVPREQWLRSPTEPWALDDVPVGGGMSGLLEGPDQGREVLPQLQALVNHLLCKHEVTGAMSAGFTWSDGAGGALQERRGREVVLCSGMGLRQSLRFVRLYAALGRAEAKPAALAKEHLTPGLTKKMVSKLLQGSAEVPPHPEMEVPSTLSPPQPASVALASPVAALRRAQVLTLGGTEALADTISAGTRLGKDLGSEEEEAFAETALGWACRFMEELVETHEEAPAAAVEWLLCQRDNDPAFSVFVNGNPRAPKKVMAAAKAAATTLELRRLQTSGQRFLPNPQGIKGFVKTGVVTSFGSWSEVPEWARLMGVKSPSSDMVPNSWQGDSYQYSQAEAEFLKDPKCQRRATVRIDEILSFEYLQYVGRAMQNCLRVERRGGASLAKYMSRVKSRDSSFWVMTITAEGDEEEGTTEGETEENPVEHLLMVEVYNGLRVIHQAEGPHPRRWPRPDAWAWLQEWAAQERLTPDGPEGVTVGPYEDADTSLDPWDIRRCFLW